MQAHRAQVIVSEDGVLSLHGIPFRRGDAVEVILLSAEPTRSSDVRYLLRGTPVVLRDPTEPVGEGDWGATR